LPACIAKEATVLLRQLTDPDPQNRGPDALSGEYLGWLVERMDWMIGALGKVYP
jgi:hypothetical protein